MREKPPVFLKDFLIDFFMGTTDPLFNIAARQMCALTRDTAPPLRLHGAEEAIRLI